MHTLTVPEIVICRTCQQGFPRTEEFWHKHKAAADGFLVHCRNCKNAHDRELETQKRRAKGVVQRRRDDRELCLSCHQRYPRTEEYWYTQRSNVDGLALICKGCRQRIDEQARRDAGIFARERQPELCYRCNQTFPRTKEFWYKHTDSPDGLSSLCKGCIKRANNEQYHLRDKHDPVRMENRRKSARNGHIRHRETRNARMRRQASEQRKLVLEQYGNQCFCCGEKQAEFLAIDHINGNGRQHRKLIGGKLYPWLIKEGFPEGFRILCHNCNSSLGFYGYCPHGNLSSVKAEV